jgi:heme/copper-type cytochrome/quinol oxidase subunit 1
VNRIALRFVKWGTGLLVLGVWTGYGPLHHYLHGGVEVACPWAPVHAHVVLLGWVGFTLFGLVYRTLPDWGTPRRGAEKLAAAHFWLSLVSVLGVLANGIFGYRLLDHLEPAFYYRPEPDTLRLWLTIDGAFLTLFALGSLPFLVVVLGALRHDAPEPRE